MRGKSAEFAVFAHTGAAANIIRIMVNMINRRVAILGTLLLVLTQRPLDASAVQIVAP